MRSRTCVVLVVMFLLIGITASAERLAGDPQGPNPRAWTERGAPDPVQEDIPRQNTAPSYIDGPPGMPDWMEDWNPWDQWSLYIQSMMYHYYFGGESVFSSLN